VSVVLEPDGIVKVDGLPIPGRWHHVQFGSAYFEDPGVLCTDEMPIGDLRQKLAEMYSARPERGRGMANANDWLGRRVRINDEGLQGTRGEVGTVLAVDDTPIRPSAWVRVDDGSGLPAYRSVNMSWLDDIETGEQGPAWGSSDHGHAMKISVERTASGKFRATSDDARIHVVGESISDSLRRAAAMLDDIDQITATVSG